MLDQALAHHQQGRLDEAAKGYRRILDLDANHADCLHLLGMVAHQQGDDDTAAELIQKAIAIYPGAASYHSNLGNVLYEQGRAQDAAASYMRALAIKPGLAEVHINLGNVFLAAEMFKDATACYARALALQPERAEAYNNLGNVLRLERRLEDSAEAYRRALALKPDYVQAHYDLGRVLQALGDLKGAVAHLRRAEALQPGHPSAGFTEAIVLLLQGELDTGWRFYERRWSSIEHGTPMREYPVPLWTGQRLESGSLLLWPEQGVGDEIMFASLLPEVLRTGNRCVLACDPRLQPLFRRSFPGLVVVSGEDDASLWAEIEAGADRQAGAGIQAHLPIGSLPGLFRNTPAAFAAHPRAYLQADPVKTAELRKRYGGGRPLVGVAWYTSAVKTGQDRSIDLGMLKPLLDQDWIRWISLQYGETDWLEEQVRAANAPVLIDRSVDQMADLDLFAAQIAALDLVITIDNSTAHLAGALGVPAWVMLPFAPDWRWLNQGETCTWYPGMRLFRQPRRGDWSPVVQEIARELPQALPAVCRSHENAMPSQPIVSP
jgi:tetratricopeptide (TPR) repeat protein